MEKVLYLPPSAIYEILIDIQKGFGLCDFWVLPLSLAALTEPGECFGWVCMLDERITTEMRWTLVKYEQNVPSSRIRTESDNGNLVFGFATFLLPLFPLYIIYIYI